MFRVKHQDVVNVALGFEPILFTFLLQNTHGTCEAISAPMKPSDITLHEILKLSYTGDFLHL